MIVVVFAILCAFAEAQQKLPSYIKTCDIKSPDYQNCALKHANEAIPYIVKGDKKLALPVLDPLKLPLIEVVQNQFKLSLKDVEITGLKNIKATFLNLNRDVFEANFYIENLNIVGKHTTNGRVLVLDLNGSGNANITAVGGNYKVKAILSEYTKKGEKYLKFGKPTVDIDLQRAYFNFNNILNGNKELEEEINKVLNDNWRDILKDVGAPIQETVSTIIESIVSNILTRVPEHELLPGVTI